MSKIINMLTIPNFFDAELAFRSIPSILSGLPMSLFLLIICFTIANILGIFIMILRTSNIKIISWFARFYISFFRGVPTLVVLFITYFGLNLDAFPAAILSLSIVSAAFVAEYYRSALLGIDHSQIEAAEALGMSYFTMMKNIVLPQVFRIVLPSLGNVMLDMFKGTSLVAMVTVSEMFMQAKIVAGANQDYMTIYIVVAFIYWIVCCVLSFGQKLIERDFDFYQKA
ncbi:amino acid ABC transporter permease [Weissella minor]|nr:amino acid ABC transporter permease [Weissella minor]